MLKRLAILAVFGTLLFWWPDVAENQQRTSHAAHAAANSDTRPSLPPNAIVYSAGCCKTETAADKKEPEEKPLPRFARPEWGIVYVTVVYAVLAGLTLRKIGVQADEAALQRQATQDTLTAINRQANLMKEQLDRMVEKERARLKVQGGSFTVEGEPPGRWILAADLEIANHGPSKAYITQKRGNLAIVKSGDSLPELDVDFAMLLPYPFDIIKPEVDPIHTVLFFEDTPSSLRKLCTELAESRLVMYLYGFIEYETMGEGWHLPFRYKWEMPMIPDNMNELDLAKYINILGGWDDPCSQENKERRIKPN